MIRKWFRDNYSNKYTRESFDYYVRIVMPILKATEGRHYEGCEGKDVKGKGVKGKDVKDVKESRCEGEGCKRGSDYDIGSIF